MNKDRLHIERDIEHVTVLTMQTSAFAATRGDKTAMRPLAKLRWSHLFVP